MGEGLVRLWDKDWNLIATGPDVISVINLNVTEDFDDGTRKVSRVESAKLREDNLDFLLRQQWPQNPYLPEVVRGD